MARKAREISLINSYTVVLNSADGILFDKLDIQNFLYTLNSFKGDNKYNILSYHLQSKTFYLLLVDIKMSIDVLLRKISVSFAKKYNAIHSRKGPVFGGRARTIPANTYDEVYAMICKIHNIDKIISSEFSSDKDYFNNPIVDSQYILDKFNTQENFLNFCNGYNSSIQDSVQRKLSDEELSKFINDTFSLTMMDLCGLSKGKVSGIIHQVAKVTKASARQISRVTCLPLRFLWSLLKKSDSNKNKVKDNEN